MQERGKIKSSPNFPIGRIGDVVFFYPFSPYIYGDVYASKRKAPESLFEAISSL
jgi:hypothetical protein